MKELLTQTEFFGVLISLGAYFFGLFLNKKLKLAIFNPLLISVVFIISALVLLGIGYEKYYEGAKFLNFLLVPTTVCLAVPLYQKLELLKSNYKAILIGVFSGVVANALSIFGLCLLFSLTHTQYVTLLPKSITTAIGMAISQELGGNVSITVAAILITGVTGSVLAEPVCRLFRIHDSVAKGVAIGTAAHVVGTAKAMEIGETEGAMSGLAILISGLLTVVCISFFAGMM